MADCDAHLRQYWHNRSLIPLLPHSHSDWIATVSFYCAVQLIDAILARDNIHPVDHKSRNGAIANVTKLEFIAGKYDPLYNLARKVRYFADPTKWIPFTKLEPELFRRTLYPIEHSAYKLLKLKDAHQTILLAQPPVTQQPQPVTEPAK